jgi:II/X family phage/plasmid replication protein
MIDTLRLESPPVDEALAKAVEGQLILRAGMDCATEELLYQFVSGSLKGSWESSVSVNVLRKKWISYSPEPGGRSLLKEVECPPYLRFEGSVHKAMLGHNVFGGPVDLCACTSWFVGDVGKRLGVDLPHWSSWRVCTLDWAEVYDLGSYEACAQYIHGLGISRYPRRKVWRYADETVAFYGTTTAQKFYHKGPEFRKNTFKQFAVATNPGYAMEVQSKAHTFLRVETSIKSKKLQSEHGGEKPHAQDISLEWVKDVYDVEVARVLKDGEADMKWVRSAESVEYRLYDVYENRLAQALYGTWLKLAANGEDAVRAKLTKATYHRHRKKLAEAGCAWHGTDVYIREDSLIPSDFRPVRSDSRRLTDESPLVKEALLGHPVAV